MLFGGISGSAIADISALGSILVPVMKDKGYDADYAVNVTVTSSIAGIIIPPSHNMIIYALATGGAVSISKTVSCRRYTRHSYVYMPGYRGLCYRSKTRLPI